MSRARVAGVLIVGILFGLVTTNIVDVMMWIVGALYGGYVMANVLKWYWWRFNGYGYFWGMMAGISGDVRAGWCHCANTLFRQSVNPPNTLSVIPC